jgi:EAL domain-containing protein (putative c-di-GMP-specific phosphodiesterase class I)/GGDEF domain-containing protein
MTPEEHKDIQGKLDKLLETAQKNNREDALIYISIDNMPMILSAKGALFAEEVMEELQEQLQGVVKKNDIVYQPDKDHFQIVVENCNQRKVDKLCHTITELIQNYGSHAAFSPVHLTSTLGAVLFPTDAYSGLDILNKAYIALKKAQEISVHHLLYGNDEKQRTESKNQLILANYLQSALAEEKLCLAFQPIIDCRTGDVAYYEALLRIIGEDGTPLTAGPFIPTAEKMGFIDVIDKMVLKMAVHELQSSPVVKLSINVSNTTIYDSDWLELAQDLLKDRTLAERLVVEITETAEQHDMKKSIHFVDTMRSLGCQLALDDFGVGYTSFSQLKHLKVDVIKIDGSFVRDIAHNKESQFFVETLLNFSKKLGLKSVAEFVENKEIVDILRELDVDYLQGNYFSPAVTYREWASVDERTPS